MHKHTTSRTAAAALVEQLVINGVRHVFCVPGESFLPVLDALRDSGITMTVCRHEGGAAMMAEAIGKATGRPGVCFVTRGPGATNASAGIHIAQQDSTPMIMFVGQVETSVQGARGVSGTRLPRGVRQHDQMDRRGRRSRPHHRIRLTRVLHREQRPARAGGVGAAQGHAERARNDRPLRRRSSRSRPRRVKRR